MSLNTNANSMFNSRSKRLHACSLHMYIEASFRFYIFQKQCPVFLALKSRFIIKFLEIEIIVTYKNFRRNYNTASENRLFHFF